MINDEINGFVNAYRDSLERQHNAELQGLKNERENQFQALMGSANRLGTMYSNFPERSKLQYDTQTYLPSVAKSDQTYQTGLQKLRTNTISLTNQLADINDAIADLNEQYAGTDSYGEATPDLAGGTTFTNNDGNAVRMSTFLKNRGIDITNENVLNAAKEYLSENEYNQLKKIIDAQASTKHPNVSYNAGSNFNDNAFLKNDGTPYLSKEDKDLMDRLGLAF